MSTLLKSLQVREHLLKRNLKIFTPEEFSRIFPLPSYKLKYFLETQTKRGLFMRLKKGLYTLKTNIPSEEVLANALYKPSYISFEYALAYYNLIPEMPYQITSATTKPTRLYSISGKTFIYYTLKKELYFGYILKKTTDNQFLIAEPEKALVDYLYFVSLGKKSTNKRLSVKNLDQKKIYDYAAIFKRKSLIIQVKQLYDIN